MVDNYIKSIIEISFLAQNIIKCFLLEEYVASITGLHNIQQYINSGVETPYKEQ